MNTKKKILIDTDAGHDDVLAIMMLLLSSHIDVKAITTVAGNSTIENVTRNAHYVANLIQKKSIPIFSGYPKPLRRKLVQAVVHGKSGLAGADTSHTHFRLTNNADEMIISEVKNTPGISIVTLGPLTNIARALLKDPKIYRSIETIVIMGGAIDVCGNKNRVAEFNMFVDPEAADIVFRNPVKKILVPLDPCNEIVLQLSDFQSLKTCPFYSELMSMMEHFIRGIAHDEKVQGALVYDALAAYYLIRPEAYDLEDMDVVIETKGEHTSGMTVAEKRKGKGKPNVRVAKKIDANQFLYDFFQILGNC